MTIIIYMVAGLSSRFGGKIKQFAKVGPSQETLIEYSLNQAVSAGFSKIIFIVGKKTGQPFKEMFGKAYKGIPVQYALQDYDKNFRDKPWGTTDALCCTRNLIREPFVVCNGDDIYGKETFRILFRHLQNSEETATIGYRLINAIPEKGAVNRGIFKTRNGYVEKITETFNIEKSRLAKQNLRSDILCSQNIFALTPRVLKLLNEKLSKFKQQYRENRKIECLLPEELSTLIQENKIKMKLYPTLEKWFGVTNPCDEAIVREQLRKITFS